METLTAQEELAFIRKVMEDSRSSFADNGKPKLVWGAIVALGMLYTYIQALAQSDLYVMWVWIGISIFGWGYIFWEDNQRDKKIPCPDSDGQDHRYDLGSMRFFNCSYYRSGIRNQVFRYRYDHASACVMPAHGYNCRHCLLSRWHYTYGAMGS